MKLRFWIALLAMVAFALPAVSAQQKEKGTSVSRSSSAEKDGKAKAVPAGPVDLNTASEKELDALPGVGPATAKKIIDHRPYGSVDDLAKAGVAQKEVERLKPLVNLGAAVPPPAAAPSPARNTTAAPTARADRSNPSSVTTPSPPAGSGMVWVNTETKIFHREGDRWYGKTKHGSYMSEADALRAGYRAAKK